MTVLKLYKFPARVLRQKAIAVDGVSADIRTLMDDMLETMYANKGMGLAANQVGILKRVIVVDIDSDDEESQPLQMANPVIIDHSLDLAEYEEGCLSVPDQRARVKRPRTVKVNYLDRNGKACQLSADDVLATCIQHEIDHLNGIMFMDRLSAVKRAIIKRKLKKVERQELAYA